MYGCLGCWALSRSVSRRRCGLASLQVAYLLAGGALSPSQVLVGPEVTEHCGLQVVGGARSNGQRGGGAHTTAPPTAPGFQSPKELLNMAAASVCPQPATAARLPQETLQEQQVGLAQAPIK